MFCCYGWISCFGARINTIYLCCVDVVISIQSVTCYCRVWFYLYRCFFFVCAYFFMNLIDFFSIVIVHFAAAVGGDAMRGELLMVCWMNVQTDRHTCLHFGSIRIE